jgi:hypothetical protein
MGEKGLDEGTVRAIQGYADLILKLLGDAVTCQRSDPERFLWHARRILEAVCLMQLCVHKREPVTASSAKKDDVRGLESLVQDLARIPGALNDRRRASIDTLRSNVNQGVHVRSWDDEPLGDLVAQSEDALAALVEWCFRQTPAVAHLKPSPDLDRLLRDVRNGGAWVTEPSQELRATSRRLAEVEQLNRELDVQLREARRLLELAQPSVADAPPGRSAPMWVWWVAGAMAAAWIVGAVVGVSGWGGVEAGGAPVGASAAPTVEAATPPVAPLGEAPPAPVVPAPAVVQACPSGLVEMKGGMVTLGQPEPDRREWPAPWRRSVEPVSVAPFCVMAKPVAWDQLSVEPGLPDVAACRRKGGADAEDGDPAGCLSRDEAESVCARLFGGGRLPSIAEWEWLWRSAPAFRHRGVYREWVSDRFPPAVLNRKGPASGSDAMFLQPLKDPPAADDGVLKWSWNRRENPERLWNDGFRCVVAAR